MALEKTVASQFLTVGLSNKIKGKILHALCNARYRTDLRGFRVLNLNLLCAAPRNLEAEISTVRNDDHRIGESDRSVQETASCVITLRETL